MLSNIYAISNGFEQLDETLFVDAKPTLVCLMAKCTYKT